MTGARSLDGRKLAPNELGGCPRAECGLFCVRMSTRARNWTLALVALLIAGFVGALFLLLRVEGPPPVAQTPREDAHAAPTPAQPAPHDEPARAIELSREGESQETPDLETTVVFPLRVTLDLVKATATLQEPGMPALRAAATARLRSRITDASGAPVRARLEFKAGPNAGRVLQCDGQGQVGAGDLFPGRALVDVTGPGVLGSLREVVLRENREAQLNISYARPTQVSGEVFDADGKPLAAAKVTVDGLEANTDDQGVFSFPRVAPGEVTVLVEHSGFASCSQLLNLTGGATIARGQLKFRLQRGARLSLTLADRVNDGAGNRATVIVLPAALDSQRVYPWWKLNPVRIYPGGQVTLEDLPPLRVAVRLFHAGAIAKPAVREIELQSDTTQALELHMEPAPVIVGVVKLNGQPVEGAEVSLEAPERVQATLGGLGETNYLLLESEIMPDSPRAVQVAITNAQGEYQLCANEDVSKVRYLVARTPDGLAQAGTILRGGETRADLTLQQGAGAGEGELVLQTNPRIQGLPVDVVVNGEPRERMVLPRQRELHVAGLVTGTWRLSVKWDTVEMFKSATIEVGKDLTLTLQLPEGAILGQDEDTRKRVRGQ